VTDFLDEKLKEIADRLKELRPYVDEHNRLEAAASALAGVGGSSAGSTRATKAKRGPGRPRGAASKTASKATARKAGRPAKRRAGRRKGSGTRAAEALTLVQGQAGITIPELAAKMGIKQNYLYRVLPGLEAEKKVTKKGRGWYAKS